MSNRAATTKPAPTTHATVVARDKRRASQALKTLAAASEGYESQEAANMLSLLTHMSGLDAFLATASGTLGPLRQAIARDPDLASLTGQAAVIQTLWALIGLVSDYHGPSSATTQIAWRHAGAIYRLIGSCAGQNAGALRLSSCLTELLTGLERCSEA